MKNEKKKYPPEFKIDAVKLITEQGYKTAEAARNLGIHPSEPDKPWGTNNQLKPNTG